MTQNNLALAYADRIRGERADNLEQSISAYEQALQVYTRDAFPEDWAMTQSNLALACWKRIRGERADNLEQSITASKMALQIYTRDTFPEHWARIQNNLAIAYRNRIRGERADNLEQSISAYEQALQVYTCDAFPEDWARTQNNLGAAYADISIRIQENRMENFQHAIDAYQLALQVYTRDTFPELWARTHNNLGVTYADISIRIQENRMENFQHAIDAYQLALQIYTCEAFPDDCRRTSHNLGNLYFNQRNWEAATTSYTTALAAAEILYQACILLDGKAAELAETSDLPRRAAYTLARVGNLQGAVLTLEHWRARGLSESLERDRANLTQLKQIAPDIYDRYQDITQQLQNLEIQQRDLNVSSVRHSLTTEAQRNAATDARQKLDAVIAQIRRVEGYAAFLEQPTFDAVRAALQLNPPLVYLMSTSTGGLALIVTPDTIESIWLHNLTEASVLDLLDNIWFAAYNQSQANRQVWLDAIAQVTHQLWQPLMAPLIDRLKQHSFQQATLIPTGYLSFLPLHAAWVDDPTQPTGKKYALDEIGFTYAPNARSLNASAAIAQGTGADSILAIDNPRNDLPNSSREVAAAVATFPQANVLNHEEATVESVLAALPDCNFLHLSCHGTANLNEPLNSGLLMSDGLLTLRQFLDLRLSEQGGIRLAILSACETGLVGFELVDEAIGLPTGLLQAGVAGVVASLWSVSDLSTMMLLMRFYDYWRNESLEPATALHHAQLWIRDTTSQQKATYFKETNPDIFQSLILLDPDYFAHPFHWAAFSYVGV